jgi:hypothetical protein
MGYAIGRVGMQEWEKMNESDQEVKVEMLEEKENKPDDFCSSDSDHQAIMWGAHLTGTTIGSVGNILAEYRKFQSLRTSFESKHGSDVYVRIHGDIMFRAYKGEMNYRHFSVLCALFSWIGDSKEPVRVTRDGIKTRQLGYRTREILEKEMNRYKKRGDGAEELSDRKLRDALDELEPYWFARVNPSRTVVYFSHRMTRDELIAATAKKVAKETSFHALKRKANEDLKAAIEKEKQALLHQKKIKDQERTKLGPSGGPQQGPSGGPR